MFHNKVSLLHVESQMKGPVEMKGGDVRTKLKEGAGVKWYSSPACVSVVTIREIVCGEKV
jgi:hypothetical protein